MRMTFSSLDGRAATPNVPPDQLAATPSQVYPRPPVMATIWDRLTNLIGGRSTAPGDAAENGSSDARKLTDQEILLGRKGESHAARYLAAKGFRILAKNLATPVGEIDLLARYKEFLVFIEVKTRMSEEPAPEEQINAHKRNQLTKAAKFYLGRYPPPMPPARFDVVSIVWPQGGQPTVKHFEHAFEATF
jgi:putative endonuclease